MRLNKKLVEKAQGSALGSDAFFPMGDTVEAAAKANYSDYSARRINSMMKSRIAKADEYGIAMVFYRRKTF